jgi:hypothetical protein
MFMLGGMRHIPTSAEKAEHLKKQARRLQRNGGGKLADLLDRVARGAGYDHWRHVTACLEGAPAEDGVALLRSRIAAFQALAVEGGRRIEVTGPEMLAVPMVMFAAEGDAWMLEPHTQECMCLAFHGERVESGLAEHGEQVTLQFHGTYRLDGDAMHFQTGLPLVGNRTVQGLPVAELRDACRGATESFQARFTSAASREAVEPLTEGLIDLLIDRGFGNFDRAELQQAAKHGAQYSPARDELGYPPWTTGSLRDVAPRRDPHRLAEHRDEAARAFVAQPLRDLPDR